MLVHRQYPAQRWSTFQDIGPSPCGREGHSMASDGRRVFVIGGVLSPGAQVDEAKLIHVLDTSMYYLFVVSFGQPSSLKHSSSFTRNPTPTLSILVRRLPNLRRSYPRVNHNSRHPFRRTRMSTQKMVLLLFKMLTPENWTIPPLCRSLAIEPTIRMTSHRYSRV